MKTEIEFWLLIIITAMALLWFLAALSRSFPAARRRMESEERREK